MATYPPGERIHHMLGPDIEESKRAEEEARWLALPAVPHPKMCIVDVHVLAYDLRRRLGLLPIEEGTLWYFHLQRVGGYRMRAMHTRGCYCLRVSCYAGCLYTQSAEEAEAWVHEQEALAVPDS